MAEAVGSVRIDLFTNLAEFDKGLSKAQGQLRRFSRDAERVGKSLESAGQRLSIGITAPVVGFALAAKNAARDAAELQSAFDVSFGDMAKTANDWAAATGNSLGRTNRTLQRAALEFQTLFAQMAPTESAAFELSKTFAQLSLDVASFRNTTDDQALQKLRSGLSGEAEPLRRLGVFINEAAVQQKAFQLGIAKTGQELTDQQKVLARAVLIMEQLKNAQGDLIRTSGSLANQEKATRAEIEKLLETIGNDLQPLFLDVLKTVRDVAKAFSGLDPEIRKSIVSAGLIAAAVGPVLLTLGAVVTTLGAFGRIAGVALAAIRGLAVGFAEGVVAARTATAANAGYAASTGGVAKGAGIATKAIGALAAAFASYEAGAAIANIAYDDEKEANKIRKRAQDVVDALRAQGVAADQARGAVARLLETQGKKGIFADLGKISVKNAKELLASGAVFETVAAKAKETAAAETDIATASDDATKAIQNLVGSFGDLGGASTAGLKDISADLDRVRAAVNPLGAAFKSYQADMKFAAIAGLDMSEAQRVLARDMINSLGGYDAVKDKLSQLPPIFREVAESVRKEAWAKEHAADIEQIRAAIDPLKVAVEDYNERMAIAKEAGLDLAKASAVLAKDVVEAAGGVKALGDNAAALPDVFRNAVDAIKLDETNERLARLADSLNDQFKGETALEQKFQDINALLAANKIDVEVYKKAVSDLFSDSEDARKQRDALKERQKTIREISDAASDAAVGTRSLSDATKELVSNMLRTRIIQPFFESMADGLLGSVLGKPGGRGGFDFGGIAKSVSGLFGGFRANGGPVLPGMAYMVGERGREIFVPDQPGRIVSHEDAMGGGFGPGVTVVQNFTGPDPGSFRRSSRQMARDAKKQFAV